MEFKDDEIKRLQLAAEAEEKKRFLHNIGSLDKMVQTDPVPNPEPNPTSPSPSNEKSSLKQIRTYQGDVASALEKQNESLVSIQKRESVKQQGELRSARPERHISWKPVLLGFLSLIFVLAGAVGAYLAYNKFQTQTAPTAVIAPANRLVPIRSEKNINIASINREQFINLVREELNQTNPESQRGEIVHWQLRKGEGEVSPIISTSEFLVLMEGRAPAALVRAFDLIFMFGLTQEETRTPFIFVKLKSFEQAFPGMLEWENNLREDLLPLFIGVDALANVSSENKFEDLTIVNKDARVLRDNSGKIALIYTFIDNEILLIAGKETSLKTLQNQYNSGKLAR